MKRRVAVWMFGGIGTGNFSQGQPVLHRLVSALSADFEVVVYSRSLVNPDFVPDGFELRCPSKRFSGGALRWLVLVYIFLKDHRRKRFQLLCAFWGFPGGFIVTLLGKFLGLPSIVNLQGGDAIGIPEMNYGILHRPVLRSLALWTYRNATRLTVLTAFQRDLLIGNGIQRPVDVIPFGADRNLFQEVRRERKTGELHFIHVSNYHPIKDTISMLKAFAMIAKQRPSRLRIVGGEYQKSAHRSLCQDLGIGSVVDFYGPIVYGQMPRQFAWADIMIHMSKYEGQGIVIAEAAQCGVLIAGTTVGLISDLGDDAAILVPTGEFRLLAEKILAVIDQTDIWESKVGNARQWASQHDFAWTVDQFKKNLS